MFACYIFIISFLYFFYYLENVLKKIIIFCDIQSSSFFKKVYFLFFTFILFLFIFKILSNYFMRKKRRKENELKVILESPFSNPISSVVSIPPPSLSWFLTVNFLSPVSLSNNAVWIGPTIHSNHNTPFLFSSLFIVILFFSLGFVNFCSSPSSPSPSLSLSLYLSIYLSLFIDDDFCEEQLLASRPRLQSAGGPAQQKGRQRKRPLQEQRWIHPALLFWCCGGQFGYRVFQACCSGHQRRWYWSSGSEFSGWSSGSWRPLQCPRLRSSIVGSL